jgi:hypothetical protein
VDSLERCFPWSLLQIGGPVLKSGMCLGDNWSHSLGAAAETVHREFGAWLEEPPEVGQIQIWGFGGLSFSVGPWIWDTLEPPRPSTWMNTRSRILYWSQSSWIRGDEFSGRRIFAGTYSPITEWCNCAPYPRSHPWDIISGWLLPSHALPPAIIYILFWGISYNSRGRSGIDRGNGCRDTGRRGRIKGGGCGLLRIDDLGASAMVTLVMDSSICVLLEVARLTLWSDWSPCFTVASEARSHRDSTGGSWSKTWALDVLPPGIGILWTRVS